MVQLSIRCLPRVPVAADELEHWLEQQVDALRAQAPHGTIRLSRLSQGLPSAIGWLVELELAEDEPLLAGERLTEALRDMRLLGLQPTLLSRPHGRTGRHHDHATHRPRRPPRFRRTRARRRVARLDSDAHRHRTRTRSRRPSACTSCCCAPPAPRSRGGEPRAPGTARATSTTSPCRRRTTRSSRS